MGRQMNMYPIEEELLEYMDRAFVAYIERTEWEK